MLEDWAANESPQGSPGNAFLTVIMGLSILSWGMQISEELLTSYEKWIAGFMHGVNV